MGACYNFGSYRWSYISTTLLNSLKLGNIHNLNGDSSPGRTESDRPSILTLYSFTEPLYLDVVYGRSLTFTLNRRRVNKWRIFFLKFIKFMFTYFSSKSMFKSFINHFLNQKACNETKCADFAENMYRTYRSTYVYLATTEWKFLISHWNDRCRQ